MANNSEPVYGEYYHQMETGQKFFTRFLSCRHGDDISLKLILLHPFPFSSRIYSMFYQSEAIKELIMDSCQTGHHLQIFFPDFQGFGKSAPGLKPKDLSEYCKIVEVLAEEGKVIVGGCSMGGYVALEALNTLNNVQGLILIDTQHKADTEEKKIARYRQAETFLRILAGIEDKWAVMGILGLKFPLVVEFEMNLLKSLLFKNTDLMLMDTAKEIMDESTLIGVVHALYAMAGRRDNSTTLSNFKGKTIIMVGEHDSVTPPDLAKQMQKIAQNSILEILPNSGHLPMLENPAEFNMRLVSRLKELRNAIS